MDETLVTVIAAIFTVVSPLAIAWKKKPTWSTLLKVGVPIVVSLVIGVLYVIYTGGITDWGDVFAVILTVYGAQQLVYTTILKQASEKLEWKGFEDEVSAEPDTIATPEEERDTKTRVEDPRLF